MILIKRFKHSLIKNLFSPLRMEASTLPYKSDRYNGVTINETEIPKNPKDFENLLKTSLDQWVLEKKRGVWLKIPIELSGHIPIGVGQGIYIFTYLCIFICLNVVLKKN